MARHYVYALIDPRDLQPFYIGKGSAQRRFSHFAKLPADVEKSGDKAKRIQEIKQAGAKPEAVVLSWHDTDEAAYAAEQEKIAAVGLKNLTNQNRGGAGDRSKATPRLKASTPLTSKQAKFAVLVADGADHSDAYRRSYNAEKSKPTTVNRQAAELMKHPNVSARVAELREKIADRVVITVERQIEKLDALIQQAIETEQVSAAAKCIELQSKLLDQFPATKNINENHNITQLGERLAAARQRLKLVS